ncbi:imelysin family protein [uncultured Aliiroseovarius sp.]|uniref:imelysin family protein n=1 Tax=uncultured Aliiroseovarius sp. TaxID=1658783 RepID=UPI002629805B|nr:imelysin family protein [uncultured Aliiroseovarius sp.]
MYHLAPAALIGFACFAAPAQAADIDHEALRDRALTVIEMQFGAFRDAAETLAEMSVSYCAAEIGQDAHTDAFKQTWLAWAPLDAYQFGPIVQNGAVLSVGFWPDKKDYVGRGLKALLTESPEALQDPATIAQHSAAVQGLPAIERLLFDDLPACPAVIGISAHLHGMANQLYADWFNKGGWADLARAPSPENPVYQSADEFTKVLFTAADFELTRIGDARLGRPLGTFNAPRPTRAEAWRAGLSFELIDAQLLGIGTLLEQGFAGDNNLAEIDELLDRINETRMRIAAVGTPLDLAVTDPVTRFRVEALQTRIGSLQRQVNESVGPAIGVETGFSAADGD